MPKTRVVYYHSPSGGNPVKDFIDRLEFRQKSKIFRLFATIENYGLISILPHTRKLIGTPLWEIRILGQDNIRFIYLTKTKDSIVVLHGFNKKTNKTPQKELIIALERFKSLK